MTIAKESPNKEFYSKVSFLHLRFLTAQKGAYREIIIKKNLIIKCSLSYSFRLFLLAFILIFYTNSYVLYS